MLKTDQSEIFDAHYFGSARICTLMGHTGLRKKRRVGYCFLDNGEARYLVDGAGKFNPKHWDTFRPVTKMGLTLFVGLVETRIKTLVQRQDRATKNAQQLAEDFTTLSADALSASDEWTKTGKCHPVYVRDEYGLDTDMVEFVDILWHRFSTEECWHGCTADRHYQRGYSRDADAVAGWSPSCLVALEKHRDAARSEVAHLDAQLLQLRALIGGR